MAASRKLRGGMVGGSSSSPAAVDMLNLRPAEPLRHRAAGPRVRRYVELLWCFSGGLIGYIEEYRSIGLSEDNCLTFCMF